MEKALFWDFDGTLILKNESFLDALSFALKKHGYRLLPDDIRSFLHKTCSWYTPEESYTGRTGTKWWLDLSIQFDEFYELYGIEVQHRETVNSTFKGYILDSGNYTLYPDAVAVLAECKAMGCMNFILSNNYPELPMIIQSLGIADYFTGYIVSSNVGYEKPRKELFDHGLSLAGFPGCSYMIGDNPVADIQGGRAAGMNTILVHHNGSDIPCIPCIHCENLADIPNYLSI